MMTKSINLKDYNLQDYEFFVTYFRHPKTRQLISIDFQVAGDKAICSIADNLVDCLFDKNGEPKFLERLNS